MNSINTTDDPEEEEEEEKLKRNIVECSKTLPQQELKLFVSNYIFEIYKLSLSNSNDVESLCAFNLILQASDAVLLSLSKKSAFYKISNQILRNKKLNGFVISRCASIFLNIVFAEIELPLESTDLFINFLQYADNTGVFDLLSTVVSPQNSSLQFVKLLTESSKTDFISALFSAMRDEENVEALSLQLFLLRHCSKNQIFKKFLDDEKSIQEINFIISNKIIFDSSEGSIMVQNYLWQTISAICSKKLIFFMQPLFEKGLKIISDPYTTLHMYHTFVVDFLGKCVAFRPNIFGKRLYQFSSVLSRLITQFPDSSNLQAAISRFICAALEQDELQGSLIEILLPLVIATAQHEFRSAAAANCAYVLHQVSILKFTHPALNSFCKKSEFYNECSKNFLYGYQKLLMSEYGGDIQTEEPKKKSIWANIKSILSPNFLTDLGAA